MYFSYVFELSGHRYCVLFFSVFELGSREGPCIAVGRRLLSL